MRLIQTDGEGNVLGEVKTFDPIAGIHDAVRIAAQQGGDGTYWADTEGGKFYEFRVENGQAHGLTEEGWRAGNPAEQIDNGETAERVRRPASEFGGFFQDSEGKDDVPAVNFLTPDVSAAVAAREAAAAEAQAQAAAEAQAAETEEEAPEGETAVGGEDEETTEGDESEAETSGDETAEAEGETADGEGGKKKVEGEDATTEGEGGDAAPAAAE